MQGDEDEQGINEHVAQLVAAFIPGQEEDQAIEFDEEEEE